MKRPNMEEIEENFKIFQRPSAEQSREMTDYIYELEKRLSTTHNSEYITLKRHIFTGR